MCVLRLLIDVLYLTVLLCTTVAHPDVTAPYWLGPLYKNVTYYGAGPFTDFYFICRLNYVIPVQSYDTAVFEVVLVFDTEPSSVTTTTTTPSVDVIFTSRQISAGFGKKVSYT